MTETLAKTLADILTVTTENAQELLASSPHAQALDSWYALAEQGDKGERQWRGNTLMRLPLSCWQETDGVPRVVGAPGASLKYSAGPALVEQWVDSPEFKARKRLCETLFGALEKPDATTSRPCCDGAC